MNINNQLSGELNQISAVPDDIQLVSSRSATKAGYFYGASETGSRKVRIKSQNKHEQPIPHLLVLL